METFFVTNDLDGNKGAGLVINATYNLTEAAFPKDIDNLISISNMITDNYVIVSTFIIVAKIGGLSIKVADMLLGFVSTAEIDVLVVNNFSSFKDIKACNL